MALVVYFAAELDLSNTSIGALPLSIKNLEHVVVKINSCAIRSKLEGNIGRFTSYMSAQRPESYADIMSNGELGSSFRISEYSIDLLMKCGIIHTEYDVDLHYLPNCIRQILVSTIFHAPKTRLAASEIVHEANLLGLTIIQSPDSFGEVENLIHSLVSLLERMRAMNLYFVGSLKVRCISPENPGLMVTFVTKEDAVKLSRRRYADSHKKMLWNLSSLFPQYMQDPRVSCASMASINFEIRMALHGSKVLSCDVEIEAIGSAGIIKCPCSMEKLETWVATWCDVEREFDVEQHANTFIETLKYHMMWRYHESEIIA